MPFPTRKQPAGPSNYEADTLKCWEGYNANYGPQGRDGLYVRIQFVSSQAQRDIFFPDPPGTKADAFLEALSALDLVELVDTDGWTALEGYRFKWEKKIVPKEFKDRTTGQMVKRDVTCEYPVEIISEPESVAAVPGANGTGVVTDDVAGSEAFLDILLEIADGRDDRELRLEAAKSDELRAFPSDFRQRLADGSAIEELMTASRLEKDNDTGKYHKVSA